MSRDPGMQGTQEVQLFSSTSQALVKLFSTFTSYVLEEAKVTLDYGERPDGVLAKRSHNDISSGEPRLPRYASERDRYTGSRSGASRRRAAIVSCMQWAFVGF